MARTRRTLELGGDPFLKLIKPFLLLLIIGLIAVLCFLLLGSTLGYVVAFLLSLVLLYLAVDSVTDLIGARANIGIYRKTASAVRQGLIEPTWIARNSTCDGIIVVDEPNLRILINGLIFRFQDIRSVTLENEFLHVDVGTAVDPIKIVQLEDTVTAEAVIARLRADLETVSEQPIVLTTAQTTVIT